MCTVFEYMKLIKKIPRRLLLKAKGGGRGKGHNFALRITVTEMERIMSRQVIGDILVFLSPVRDRVSGLNRLFFFPPILFLLLFLPYPPHIQR